MKTAGQLLNDARLHKKLDLSEIARVTKIREQFLRYIEADDYSRLPSGATARGFIRNYSEFIGLKPDYVLAVFRRDFVENKQGQIVPRGLAEPVAQPSVWTPKSTIIAGVVCVCLIFAAYVVYQYRILTGPPPLTIKQPTEVELQVTEPSIVITGQTDPEATISINGQLVALEKGGNFSVRVSLGTGQNVIAVEATSKSGKKTVQTRRVNLTP